MVKWVLLFDKSQVKTQILFFLFEINFLREIHTMFFFAPVMCNIWWDLEIVARHAKSKFSKFMSFNATSLWTYI